MTLQNVQLRSINGATFQLLSLEPPLLQQQNLALTQLSDVSIASLEDSWVVAWDDVLNAFTLKPPTINSFNLDVNNFSSISKLVFNTGDFTLDNLLPNTVNISANPLSLDNLTDTIISNPEIDQVLAYNGSAWVNQDIPVRLAVGTESYHPLVTEVTDLIFSDTVSIYEGSSGQAVISIGTTSLNYISQTSDFVLSSGFNNNVITIPQGFTVEVTLPLVNTGLEAWIIDLDGTSSFIGDFGVSIAFNTETFIGKIFHLTFDGIQWIDLNQGQSVSSGVLLGRASAGTGQVQEIALGTNLSLTGNTLNATGSGSSTTSLAVFSANASQTVNTTATKIAFPTAEINTLGVTVAISTDFTVTSSGWYEIAAKVHTAGSMLAFFYIYVNNLLLDQQLISSSEHYMCKKVFLNAGAVINVQGLRQSGATTTYYNTGAHPIYKSQLSILKLS